ncbi:probable mediator of RNA polymerase II transcription subunit 26b [Impatiens glandulifera]|uniref:probable mediator of RNA polymerase II transcription subunit 26b n=1 Tax=Impatiens glandulifera TaxID=253017 RepID=UPI001FB19D4B|nr:probable mediator of RNA polymerase II transcription subunit 26b [Impatiens glandulifera]
MTVKSDKLDFWRVYFRSSNSDLFDIIDNAITIAIIDCPTELKLRRDRIAEKLFSCHMSRYLDRDCVEYSNPKEGDVDDEDEPGIQKGFDTKIESGGSKESKVNSSGDYHGEFQLNQTSNYSYGDAEALTDEIEEENLIFQEVLRIKKIIDNNQDESDTILFDSLRKLQLMDLSVETLKATKIGKSVNSLRKHRSKQIRNLSKTLIEVWKEMVDEWVKVTTDLVAEATPESGNPSVVNEVEEEEEEGLPSPPLDDLAFIDTHTTTMELSKFFDGMDEDGNPQNSRELNKNRDNTRNQRKETRIVPNQRKEQVKKEETVVMKQQKPIIPSKEFEQRRMTKPNVQPKPQSEVKVQPRMQMKPQPPSSAQLDKSKTNLDENAKLEIAKRKLHDSYQQVQNAKRQRTIQVMEIQDCPKQGLGHRNPHMKPGNNNNRNWKNGVRR